MFNRVILLALVSTLILSLAGCGGGEPAQQAQPEAAAPAAAAQERPLCSAPPGVDALEHPPVRIRERITQGLPIKIVAIGSSSRCGAADGA